MIHSLGFRTKTEAGFRVLISAEHDGYRSINGDVDVTGSDLLVQHPWH